MKKPCCNVVTSTQQRKSADILRKSLLKPKSKPKPAASPAGDARLGYMEKRELEALPKTIEAMEQELAGIFQQMSSPDFYKNDAGALSRMTARQKELETSLDAAYARREVLEARIKV